MCVLVELPGCTARRPVLVTCLPARLPRHGVQGAKALTPVSRYLGTKNLRRCYKQVP